MPKTKEELDQLKKDYLNLAEQARSLSDEELENVAGGCSTYSGETYNSLGIKPSEKYNQSGSYHPLITTELNSCKLLEGGSFCFNCDWLHKERWEWNLYCRARSEESDTGK